MDNWADFRLILAIARSGSLMKAAKHLGVNHSTVFRRLNELEQELGSRLFERLPGGHYKVTGAGERISAAAEKMEGEVFSVMRDLAGEDHRLSGRLRVTSSETLAFRILTQLIGTFRSAHPGIAVQLTIDNRILSLSRHEADIALRAMRPKEGHLWGRKMVDAAWTIYGSEAFIQSAGPVKDLRHLSNFPIIGWDEAAANIAAVEWLNSHVGTESVVYRSNSLINQLMAAKNGIGLAALPCYLGDPEPGLKRAYPKPVPELTRELWIVTHTDLKDTARIRAFFDIVGGGIAAQKKLFAGR